MEKGCSETSCVCVGRMAMVNFVFSLLGMKIHVQLYIEEIFCIQCFLLRFVNLIYQSWMYLFNKKDIKGPQVEYY